MTGWREYQNQVADLFRSLGCLAEVEASVKGVRATHDIDVWVVFNTGFRRIKVDRLPAPVGIDFDADRGEVSNSKEEFIELAGAKIEYVNA